MKLKALIVAVLIFISFKGYSQDGFTYATTAKDGTEFYYKIKDIDNGFSTEVWIKSYEKAKKVKNKKGKYITVGGGYTLSLLEIFCYSQTYKIKALVKYNSRGQVVSSDNIGSVISENIVPGSVMESIYNEVCG